MRPAIVLASALVCAALAACGWDPSRPFDRDAPAVKQAIADLDGGDAGSATGKLEDYLSTGACKDGNIGAPDVLKRRADGTFDLGLSLFKLGEQYGRRFGEEEIDAGVDEQTRALRHAQIECARRVVEAIADDPSVPLELRARARYLEGNLAFLDGDYEGAVRAYDRALVLAPGQTGDAGDPVGRDAAWNRAIALRRIEDKKDAGQDASPDAQDSGQDARPDAPQDGGQDAHDSGYDAASEGGGGDSGGTPDAGSDGGSDGASPPPPSPEGGAEPDGGSQPPPPTTSEDERMLDQLESAPTLQQEEARRAGKKRVRGMADK
ncbi:MAG: tetratricopeptide repeat protein [Polyangiaceae bacterium]|jgi:tetratricopeptide (TPR) repeat protein